MNEMERNRYNAPQLTVVSFKSEQGFAATPHFEISTLNENVETHTERSGWGNDANNSFF